MKSFLLYVVAMTAYARIVHGNTPEEERWGTMRLYALRIANFDPLSPNSRHNGLQQMLAAKPTVDELVTMIASAKAEKTATPEITGAMAALAVHLDVQESQIGETLHQAEGAMAETIRSVPDRKSPSWFESMGATYLFARFLNARREGLLFEMAVALRPSGRKGLDFVDLPAIEALAYAGSAGALQRLKAVIKDRIAAYDPEAPENIQITTNEMIQWTALDKLRNLVEARLQGTPLDLEFHTTGELHRFFTLAGIKPRVPPLESYSHSPTADSANASGDPRFGGGRASAKAADEDSNASPGGRSWPLWAAALLIVTTGAVWLNSQRRRKSARD